jgi:hypothetical protein
MYVMYLQLSFMNKSKYKVLKCEIWGFHGGKDDDAVLLGFEAV